MDAIFVLHSQKTIESMTLSQNDTSVTIIDKICSEKFGFCTIQVLYFEVLTDDITLLDAILNYESCPRMTKWHQVDSCF